MSAYMGGEGLAIRNGTVTLNTGVFQTYFTSLASMFLVRNKKTTLQQEIVVLF